MKYKCEKCENVLTHHGDELICNICNFTNAVVENGVVVYSGCEQKTDFFDKQSVEKLTKQYDSYNKEQFEVDMRKTNLLSMDKLNKKVGITQKLWWERHIGKLEYSNILEVGCGVNYLVPYWLNTNNNVAAFDVSQEAVFLLKNILTKMQFPEDQMDLFVCDAERLNIDMKFDVISINNVLHHVEDKNEVLTRLMSMLNDNGKILLVEPNYYYPFRWIVETDIFGKLNIVKKFFEKNYLIEEDEKAIKFKLLKQEIVASGLNIDVNFGDPNYLGYATIYFLDNYPRLSKLIYFFDKYLLSKVIPKFFAPFEYMVISKK
jgi:2-polyprenyl-3-methyl-5-hydroxy-6-metoxy-1,4-benzoquinol methylase